MARTTQRFKLRALGFLAAPDALIGVNEEGNIELVNRQALREFGYLEDELIGQPIELLVPVASREAHIDQRLKYLERPKRRPMAPRPELTARRRDGSEFPVEVSLSPVESAEGLVVVASVRDASERKKADATIRRLAYHDPLTGLPNRELLKDRLHVALAQARRSGKMLAVVYLDLDHFKNVNDTLGHSVGDKLLQGVGRQLSRLLREGDTVARVGGDEFVMLLPRIEEVQDVVGVALRTLKRLSRRRTLQRQEIVVTASLGISIYPSDGEETEDLLIRADRAMYRAKDRGRNQHQLYHTEMTADIQRRLLIESELRTRWRGTNSMCTINH